MTHPKPKPEYRQDLLIRLIHETKDYKDLVSLTTLYVDLEEQGDIVLTNRIILEIKSQHQYFNFKQ